MSEWFPHVTVATVVFNEGRYLMVEERDKTSGRRVF
ncbi:MAG TPA: NUDIX hydrolase, partial [Halieaceae bacterium]|nr:NUDIX hydrolase [Halieaceae bacterium]